MQYSVIMRVRYTILVLLFLAACSDPCWKLCRRADRCFEDEFEQQYDEGRSDCRNFCGAELERAYAISNDCGTQAEQYFDCVADELCDDVHNCKDSGGQMAQKCEQTQ